MLFGNEKDQTDLTINSAETAENQIELGQLQKEEKEMSLLIASSDEKDYGRRIFDKVFIQKVYHYYNLRLIDF